MLKRMFLIAAALVITVPALAQTSNRTGTTDAYTPAQQAKAMRAARGAGFKPGAVVMEQGGAFFIKATKGKDSVLLTVAQDGKVYPSAPVLPGPG